MTLRTKTLTAVAALTLSATGFALAQDAAPATPQAEQATPAPTGPTVEPFATEDTAPAAEAPAEAAPADEAAAEAESAPEAPVVEEPAAEAPAADAPAAGGAEAPAEDAPAAGDAEAPAEDAEPTAPTEAPEDMPAAHSDAQDVEQEAGNLPQNPAGQQPTANQGGVDAVAQPEGDETSVPVPTQTGTEPIEEHAGEILGEEGAEEYLEEHTDEHAEEGDHGYGHVEDIDFSFEGPFGSFDQFQLQRGLQVYTEVCSACHGMKFVPIRTLSDEDGPGLPEDQVRAYATNLLPVFDDEIGEERARVLTDTFPEVAGAGMGPDLSLMAKARAGFHGPYGTGLSQLVNGMGGPEYIHAILAGYTGETQEQAGTLLYGNSAFPGGWISMPPPLSEGLVTYEDGTPATVDQMSTDVAAFLMWTAEPKLMDRKSVGLVAVLFLLALTVLLYLTNKRLWAPHKTKRKH